MAKTSIGDCLVHRGMPPNNNPYLGKGTTHVLGEERRSALKAFREGGDTTGFTFWHAPCTGGAYQITDPNVVRW